MKAKAFRAVVLSGHKENAVEVPFDPAAAWNVETVAIRPGRRGFAVTATIGEATIESFVVARSRKHWLLLDEAAMRAIGGALGEEIEVSLIAR